MTTAVIEKANPGDGLNIYQIIGAIKKESGALAPTRDESSGLKFAFRGVNAVVDHLAPFLDKYGVLTIPRVIEHKVTARELQGGKAITQTEVLTSFVFYAPDGTSIEAITAGLAQDYADRSTAQAQSVAYRVALLQAFNLPTSDKEPEVAGEETQKYIAEAHASTPKDAPKNSAVDQIKRITDWVSSGGVSDPKTGEVNELSGSQVTAVALRVTGDASKAWKTDYAKAKSVADAIEAGSRA